MKLICMIYLFQTTVATVRAGTPDLLSTSARTAVEDVDLHLMIVVASAKREADAETSLIVLGTCFGKAKINRFVGFLGTWKNCFKRLLVIILIIITMIITVIIIIIINFQILDELSVV